MPQTPGFPWVMDWALHPLGFPSPFLLPCAFIEMSLTAQEKALSLFSSLFFIKNSIILSENFTFKSVIVF